MTAHSNIGFSSRSRWSKCPGSVKLSVGIEGDTSEYAEEGTLAHALQEACLKQRKPPKTFVGKELVYEDHGETKKAVIALDMAEYLTPHIEEILEHVSKPGVSLWIELRVDLSALHPSLFGTADVVIYDSNTQTLFVRDLKYGQGVLVQVSYPDGAINPQIEGYALGVLYSMPKGSIGPVREVVMVIDQPRIERYGSDRVVVDMLDFTEVAFRLEAEASATDARDAEFVYGDHCRWCKAAFKCPLLAEITERFMKMTDEDLQDPIKLAEALDMIPAIEKRIKSLNQLSYNMVTRGKSIPGYKLVDKRANRKWLDEEKAVEFLKSHGIEAYQEPKIITPAAAEGKLSKGERPALNELCIRESSGSTLVRDEDGRPERPKIPDMPLVED